MYRLHDAFDTIDGMYTASSVQMLCGRLDRREIGRAHFIEDCTRLIATATGCSRAGIWLFEDSAEGVVMRCLGIYDRGRDAMTLAPNESRRATQAYFEALEQSGYVMASDVHAHPVTAGLFDPRTNENDVRSLMAASFAVNGQLFGTFTCSQVRQPMNWSAAQLFALKRIGGRASLALAGATQTRLSTFPMPL
jgi:GAF domain-containing protein